MIQIVIVGISADPIEFLDGSDTKAITEKLMGGFGKGLLKQRLSDGKWVGVLSATLEAGEYAYHVTTQAPAVRPFEVAVPNHYAELFAYFRATPPPEGYGTEFLLPEHLSFPFQSKPDVDRLFIVRHCYQRILSIVNRRLALSYEGGRGSGIIFSGAQGNGKTWCSLLIVWELVYQNKTVVYELCEQGQVFVIPANGHIRCLSTIATGGTVPELNERETVHVFDGKASACHEPAASRAFLIVTTSRNSHNFAQTSRRPDLFLYCIPSYEVDELLRQCARFGVDREVVLQRCAQLGPSIRYILINDFEVCKQETMAVARRVTAGQMDAYIDDVNLHAASGKTDIAACLLVVLVREDLFVDPDDAYKAMNVSWEFGSRMLCALVLATAQSDATAFVKNFITEVNSQGITKMKGVAGNYLELIISKFISTGVFEQCRKLGEARDGEVRTFINLQQPFNGRSLTVQESDITTVLRALAECTDESLLYSFCKCFPAVDFAAMGFRVVFQVTDSGSHPIQLSAIKEICRHVRLTYGPTAKVMLLFVVPEEIVQTAGNWQYTQSFVYEKEETIRKRRRGASAGEEVEVTEVKKHQSKYVTLPEEDKLVLNNLEQWVVCYK